MKPLPTASFAVRPTDCRELNISTTLHNVVDETSTPISVTPLEELIITDEETAAKTRRGLDAEKIVKLMFWRAGRQCLLSGCRDYDLWIDGWRVDVKTALPHDYQGIPAWKFRLGKDVKRAKCDFFLLRALRVPYLEHAAHFLLRAPFYAEAIVISFRALITQKHASLADDFRALENGDFGLGSEPKPSLSSVRKSRKDLRVGAENAS